MTAFKKTFSLIKKRKFWIIGIVIIAGILFYFFSPKSKPPVPTQIVKRSDIQQTISVSGKVNAKKIVDLSFQIAGMLTYLGVNVGDHVSKNQTIAMLDSRTVQKNLQASLIDYSKQRNTFDQTQSDNQNRTPDQALNDIMKRILENNQNDLNKSINSLEIQSLAKEQSVLTTPIDGIVTRTDAKTAGVNILPTTIFEVIDPNSLVFAMDVDEADIGKITVGQKTELTLDAYPDQTVTLPVNFIDYVSHTTSTGGNAYTVEVVLSDPSGGKYRVGMNGNANIVTAEKHNVITVPIASIVNNQFVYIKTTTGFEKRNVQIGIQNDTDSEITNGLIVGDVVVIDPNTLTK